MGGISDIVVKVIDSTGVIGAVLIALVVSLGLVVVIFARWADIKTDTKTAAQQTEFQDKLLKAVDRLITIEASLRSEVESLQDEKEALQRSVNEATVAIELMRAQQRRLIDLLRDVLAGRRTLDSIDATELGP